MNWLTKIKTFGDKIKRNLQKKFPTKEEIANSDWTSFCKGPVLKKDLEDLIKQIRSVDLTISPLPSGILKLINFFFILFKFNFKTNITEMQAKTLFIKLLVECLV